MTILAIESSCDETSAAIVENSRALCNIISSQHFHGRYGGVVPELASRAHLAIVSQIVENALETAGKTIGDIDAIAATSAPGLVGSLIVGSNFAKGLALRCDLPVVPVNHIEGHIYSASLEDPSLEFPFLSLVVSGGHTTLFNVKSFSEYEVLGSTLDDAAGEAFDKIAKLLGLGYPGGPAIDSLSRKGDRKAYDFPRSMLRSGDFNFSFSGLKTSVRYFVQKSFPSGVPEERLPDLAASVQEAIVDALTAKTIAAAKKTKVKSIAVSGGVSANSRLREKIQSQCEKLNIKFVAPKMEYCMDNAAMIAYLAEKKAAENLESYRDLTYTVNPSALRAGKKKKK